jgi:hypothetical protein
MWRWCLPVVCVLAYCRGQSRVAMAQVDAICGSVTQYLRANRPTAPGPSLVFRCRPMDNCGGLGDRMAGLASAAYIAFLTNRTLRADFPGLQMCFGSLGPPLPPGLPLEYPPVTPFVPLTRGVTPITGSEDSAVVNALGALLQISDLPKLSPFRTVYYHCNRGVSPLLLPPQADRRVKIPVWHIQQCILRTLFKTPRPKFLNHTVELAGGKSMKVRELLEVIQSNATTSIGIHLRLSDDETRNDEAPLRRQHADTVHRIGKCIAKVAKRKPKAVVYVSSNSILLGEVLLLNYGPHSETRVMVQKPGPIRHIDFIEWPTKLRNSSSPGFHQEMNSAVVQTVVDFYLLSRTKELVITDGSGFSMAAVLISTVDPVIRRLRNCRVTQRQCVGRFCDL